MCGNPTFANYRPDSLKPFFFMPEDHEVIISNLEFQKGLSHFNGSFKTYTTYYENILGSQRAISCKR